MATRGVIAPLVRDRIWAYTGLAIVALVFVVTGPVSDVARFFVLAVLAVLGVVWIELTRTQTMREFPDSSATVVFTDVRDKLTTWWAARGPKATSLRSRPADGGDLIASLERLADLHAHGHLSDEEFAAAKARLLAAP